MRFLNLTKHDIAVYKNGKVFCVIRSKGVARLRSYRRSAGEAEGVPLKKIIYGPPTDLPEPEEGVYIIVPVIMKLLLKGKRNDLVTPTEIVYNEHGVKIGCRSLSV